MDPNNTPGTMGDSTNKGNYNLGERISSDLTHGWNYFSVDGHKPLPNLRAVTDQLTAHGEVICRPDTKLIQSIDGR